MQATLAAVLNSMSAYVRPTRASLPVFTNGNHYEPLDVANGSGGVKDRKRGSKRRMVIRCLIPSLIMLAILLWWSSKDAFKPPPPPGPVPDVDPFEQCAQAVADNHVPTAEEITSQNLLNLTYGAGTYHHEQEPTKWAKVITPDQLMDMLENGQNPGPRILHQSWKNAPLPEHFERWSKKWKKMLDDTWVYVLWRDDDNRRLVERYYSKYLKAYDALPREIYRADMVRNMYMHRFGGVYADLDLVPLQPLADKIPLLRRTTPPPVNIAYLGHMGDDNYEHSIPNAWMLSVMPNHPFWLGPLEFVKSHQEDEAYNSQPEGLTGPVALRACYKTWEKTREEREGNGEFAEVRVLDNSKIYPFSWYDSPLVDHCLCRLHSDFFNETRCHYRHPDSWTITYWTHSWGF